VRAGGEMTGQRVASAASSGALWTDSVRRNDRAGSGSTPAAVASDLAVVNSHLLGRRQGSAPRRRAREALRQAELRPARAASGSATTRFPVCRGWGPSRAL
jgi:hypothetical protein